MKRYGKIIFLIIGFVLLEADVVMYVDQPLSDFMRGLDTSHPALIDFFRAITDLGKSKWYLWPAGLGIILCAVVLRTKLPSEAARKKLAILGHQLCFAFFSIGASGIVTDIIKPILGRARPVEWAREHIYGFYPLTFHATYNSMPSGHATTDAALATLLLVIFPRWRWQWIALGGTLAVSRVVVNAHYLADICAGIIVGCLTTLAFVHLRDQQGMFPKLKGIFPIDSSRKMS